MFVPQHEAPARAEDRPLELVERELTELCSQLNSNTCRWLELIAEFDRRDGWMEWHGCRSCADWLAWRCALTSRAAREHVRVARRLDELPLVHAAFAVDELSFSKVRAITRIAEPHSEADLLELARHATASQLERMIRIARKVTSEHALRSHERAYCLWSWDDDGSLVVKGQLPAEEGAAFIAAMNAARDVLRERRRTQREAPETPLRGSAEPRSGEDSPDMIERPAPRRWPTGGECFAYVAETALSHIQAGPSSCRAEIRVHTDAHIVDGECHIEDETSIAGATARRVACDAAIVRASGGDGEPMSVGRRSRSVPAAIRRALEVRDGGCRYPGCEQRRFTDAHHIRHWADGGETSLQNLILLCRRHHRLVHEGGHSVEVSESGEVDFRDHLGQLLSAAPPLPRPNLPRMPAPRPILTGAGEGMHLDLCVDAVLGAGRHARDDLPRDVAV